MDVSIIIVNYKTSKLIINAINSLIKFSEGFSFEIIIVDNNSNDGSIESLHRNFGEKIKVIRLEENLGFGKANNIGLEYASGEYILFLNPDIIFLTNAIRIMLDHFDKIKNLGAVGGNLHSQDMKPAYSHSRIAPGLLLDIFPLLTLGFSKKLVRNFNYNFSKRPIIVSSISGADMMVKRSIIDEIGGFNPIFFMYYEDTELNWRIRKAGYKIYNIPTAKLIHLEGSSFELNETRIRYSLQSREKYYILTKGRTCIFLLNILFLFSVNLNIFVLNIMRRDSSYFKIVKRHFIEIRKQEL